MANDPSEKDPARKPPAGEKPGAEGARCSADDRQFRAAAAGRCASRASNRLPRPNPLLLPLQPRRSA